MNAFAGIDVAFAKRKCLPVCVCVREGARIAPLPLATARILRPPVGHGNAATLDSERVVGFADQVAEYLREVEKHFGVTIRRIGIDAPSDPRRADIPRRQAEIALDMRRISCFTTPSASDFDRIRTKARAHLVGGGAPSRLPHANQLWMLVGFALFERLRREWECLEVFPQATVCSLGANAIHKSRAGGVAAQGTAVAQLTGWPTAPVQQVIKAAVHGPAHDGLDAYLSAWVAALDPVERVPLGHPPNDVIWVPAVGAGALGRMSRMDQTFGSHSFALVGILDPDRDRLGQIIEYTYDLADSRLNAHGSGPFCNFQLPNAAIVAGVYAVTVRDELVYVGECQNVAARFGPGGYGHIDPRNCHADGQSTNCKVNARVLEAVKLGFPVNVWFLSTDRRFEIESDLIQDLRPPWNSRRATRSRRVAAKDTAPAKASKPAGGFAEALDSAFRRAESDRGASVRINAGELHREVSGYPGPSHRMPRCCRAMRNAMENGDRVIEGPPSGSGASLTIEYRLPRIGGLKR